MTETQTQRPVPLKIQSRPHSRYGSVGFRLADPHSPALCRQAARKMLTDFRLTWKRGLVDDVETIVSELVTNSVRYALTNYPAGSLTLWHPNQHLIITVHDKSPYIPYKETYQGLPNPGRFNWGIDQPDEDYGLLPADLDTWSETGRGLAMVRALASNQGGELDWARDGDLAMPGKVARVKLWLGDFTWPHTYVDPWTNRVIPGTGQ
ncbi:ATP-binding protein [Streptomyces cyaneofuscatus]|uniref:ATP-binding protein n=1 Tax=Streptomyces cyaneofuscatus TaxID=66883 RepID=UPI00363268A7